MSTKQGELYSPVRNSGLFSGHWLENRLVLEPEWSEQEEEVGEAVASVLKLWNTQESRVEKYGTEASLEQAFIQPILSALGWKLKYQTYLKGREPDYALFTTDADLDAALNVDYLTDEFWIPAAVVADAKRWDLPLDKKIGSGAKKEYPPEQIEWYLDRSRKSFGILTNGRLWRLVPRELGPHQRRYQTYYEIDLVSILNDRTGDELTFEAAADFRRFFLFFGPSGFASRNGRKPLVDRAVEGSSEYRHGVSEGLKERAFDALRICIEGFLAFTPNHLTPESDLDACRENGFTLLCRLLFILFAEDRRLLPYKVHPTYTRNRSLGIIREEIASRLDKVALGQPDYARTDTGLWEHLVLLFDLIDRGHGAYKVPAYNGGLFNTNAHPFLEVKKLSDWYVAQVIDNLSRAVDPAHRDFGPMPVDYRDLAIQHLGGIYEGLLEHHPVCATVKMIVYTRRNKGVVEEKYVPETEKQPEGFTATTIEYGPGSVYLVRNKDERRNFGSYYTPDNIVNHIIRQTVDPICDEITEGIRDDIDKAKQQNASDSDLEKLYDEFPNRFLKLRILDPAMGSGHFLISACQYLAEQIATNPYTPPGPETGTADDALSFWKRRVIENCLYGVDVNPLAVDLARLALWLETVAKDRPLTFLDHHLKHGNSLIGARLARLGALCDADYQSNKAFTAAVKRKLPALLDPLAKIRDLPSDTIQDVKNKEKQFDAYEKAVEPLWLLADAWVAHATGREVSADDYGNAAKNVDKPGTFKPLTEQDWFKAPAAFARSALHAFHWDLAFPEVFCDLNGPRADGGFDAIIGNPPYEVLSQKESGIDPTNLKAFVGSQAQYAPAIRGKQNLYKLFICRSLDVLRDGGRFGFIVPMALLGDDQAAGVRRHMVEAGEFTAIDAFPQKDSPNKRVFYDAKLSTTVFSYVKTTKRSSNRPCRSRLWGENIIEVQALGDLALMTPDIPLYDPNNFTIVSCGQDDWDLAVRVMKSGRMTRLGTLCKSYQGEVNETNEKDKCLSRDTTTGPLVLRGANVCQYLIRDASQGESVYLDVKAFQAGKSEDTKAFASSFLRVGFQRKAPQNNFRRLIAAEIPEGRFCMESISYVTTTSTKLPLRFLLALLNSLFSDWYFRLGSSNAQANEYQFNNLPCPAFRDTPTDAERGTAQQAIAALAAVKIADALATVDPLLTIAPFSPAVQDVVVAAVDRIIEAETNRGPMTRSDRSDLCEAAQPFQDFLDEVFFRLAGLTDAEGVALKARYAAMVKVK